MPGKHSQSLSLSSGEGWLQGLRLASRRARLPQFQRERAAGSEYIGKDRSKNWGSVEFGVTRSTKLICINSKDFSDLLRYMFMSNIINKSV